MYPYSTLQVFNGTVLYLLMVSDRTLDVIRLLLDKKTIPSSLFDERLLQTVVLKIFHRLLFQVHFGRQLSNRERKINSHWIYAFFSLWAGKISEKISRSSEPLKITINPNVITTKVCNSKAVIANINIMKNLLQLFDITCVIHGSNGVSARRSHVEMINSILIVRFPLKEL